MDLAQRRLQPEPRDDEGHRAGCGDLDVARQDLTHAAGTVGLDHQVVEEVAARPLGLGGGRDRHAPPVVVGHDGGSRRPQRTARRVGVVARPGADQVRRRGVPLAQRIGVKPVDELATAEVPVGLAAAVGLAGLAVEEADGERGLACGRGEADRDPLLERGGPRAAEGEHAPVGRVQGGEGNERPGADLRRRRAGGEE